MSSLMKKVLSGVRSSDIPPSLEFAVIGLGRFGASVGQVLTDRGFSVLGIDSRLELVQKYSNALSQTVRLDSTDPDALREVDITAYPTVVVAIGSNLEASLLTIVALKSLGISKIIAKATTKTHRDLLLSVGADRVVLPEYERGERLAIELAAPLMAEVLQVTENLDIAAIPAIEPLIGKPWQAAESRVQLVAIERGGSLVSGDISAEVILEEDQLILAGTPHDLSQFISWSGTT